MIQTRKFMNDLKINDIFWVKDGVGIGDCDIYHMWKVMEKERYSGMNHSNIFDNCIYSSYVLRLYNDVHGFCYYALNWHNGEFRLENEILSTSQNNIVFRKLNNLKYPDYFEAYTQQEFKSMNEKERSKFIKDYVNYCVENGQTPDLNNSDSLILFSTIPAHNKLKEYIL